MPLLCCAALLVGTVAVDDDRAGATGAVLDGLTVTPATTGADIEWSVVAGAAVDRFLVEVTRAGSSVPERSATCDAALRSMVVRGLRSGATYVVTVHALAGGHVVDAASASVQAGPSLATVTTTPVATGVRVAWSTRPGAAVHGFRVTASARGAARPATTTDVEAATTSVVLRRLRAGVRYTVTVHALLDGEPTDTLSSSATAAPGAPYWPGWDIARGVALAPAGGGYTLDAWGAVHAWADADHAAPAAVARLRYWRGRDITRGLALLPNGRGGLVLDGQGHIRSFGIGGDRAPAVHGEARSAGDRFRAIAVLPDGTGGYTLDASGGLHPFAIGGGRVPPAARPGGPWPAGREWARGVAVTGDGRGGFVLDAFGHAFPFSAGAARPPRPPSGLPRWSFPIVRGASVPAGTTTGVVLDGFGGVHRFRS